MSGTGQANKCNERKPREGKRKRGQTIYKYCECKRGHLKREYNVTCFLAIEYSLIFMTLAVIYFSWYCQYQLHRNSNKCNFNFLELNGCAETEKKHEMRSEWCLTWGTKFNFWLTFDYQQVDRLVLPGFKNQALCLVLLKILHVSNLTPPQRSCKICIM